MLNRLLQLGCVIGEDILILSLRLAFNRHHHLLIGQVVVPNRDPECFLIGVPHRESHHWLVFMNEGFPEFLHLALEILQLLHISGDLIQLIDFQFF
jgi:hypothetical protein